MSGEIKDGKFVVNHNSFSSYALVDKSVDDENNNTVKPDTKKTSKKNNKSSNTISAVNSVKKSSKGASVKSTSIPKTAGKTKNFTTIGSLVLAGTVVIIAAKAKKRDEE